MPRVTPTRIDMPFNLLAHGTPRGTRYHSIPGVKPMPGQVHELRSVCFPEPKPRPSAFQGPDANGDWTFREIEVFVCALGCGVWGAETKLSPEVVARVEEMIASGSVPK